MRVLVDITHPADVHFYRRAIQHWHDNGDEVLITSRNKGVVLQLLDDFDLPHTQVGKKARGGVAGLAVELVERGLVIRRLVNQFKPDVATGFGGTFVAYACLGKDVPVVIFTDTEAKLANAITMPIVDVIATPAPFQQDFGKKHICFNGFKELAYTHPTVFTPDPKILAIEGLEVDEPFSILRLVSWQASHDIQLSGIPDVERVVETLAGHGRVIISSERPLPKYLHKFEMKGMAKNMLHLQAFAHLLFGESGSMATECTMLGTPAIFYNPARLGSIRIQEDVYGMLYTFNDTANDLDKALAKAVALLSDPDTQILWQEKRHSMLADTIDMNAYIIDLIAQSVN